jgi:hypothetical protein
MSSSRRTVLVVVLAVLGIALAAAITWATSRLVSQHIGLTSEPLTAGSRLLPAARTPARAPGSRVPAPATATSRSSRSGSSTSTSTRTPAKTSSGASRQSSSEPTRATPPAEEGAVSPTRTSATPQSDGRDAGSHADD